MPVQQQEIALVNQPDRARPRESMREKIKATATGLFICHGYRGVSFGDIASELGITRANIHYHFGNKQKLLEEVLEDYVNGTLARMAGIWRDDTRTFSQKVEGIHAFNRERYTKFNRGPGPGGKHWSLITRMRNDSDVIGEKARSTLQRFARVLSSDIEAGVRSAMQRSEIKSTAPVTEIVVQAVSIVNAAGTITQDAGNFDRLDILYPSFLRTVQAAYGTMAGNGNGRKKQTKASTVKAGSKR